MKNVKLQRSKLKTELEETHHDLTKEREVSRTSARSQRVPMLDVAFCAHIYPLYPLVIICCFSLSVRTLSEEHLYQPSLLGELNECASSRNDVHERYQWFTYDVSFVGLCFLFSADSGGVHDQPRSCF